MVWGGAATRYFMVVVDSKMSQLCTMSIITGKLTIR